MKQPIIVVLITFFAFTLTPTPQVLGKKAQTFTDWQAFQSAVGTVTVIDFEYIASESGQAGAVELTGDEFPRITLTPGDEDGLFVGIPDPSISRSNDVNFFANDFFPGFIQRNIGATRNTYRRLQFSYRSCGCLLPRC